MTAVDVQDHGSVSGDRQALADLYNATGGDSWSNRGGWLSGDPSDGWYGVKVNADGRVIRLDLSGNNLQGSLPESIGNLTELQYLNLKQNELSGSLPSSIGNLASLTHLLLNGRTIDLDTDGSYHPGKPYGGSWADERSNNFTGSLPASIGNLSNLRWLEMSGSDAPGETGLTGAIPAELGQLSNLRGLCLAFNSITSLPDLGSLSRLERLILEGNEMDGQGLPGWVGELTNLRNLWIAEMHLGGEIPDLSRLTKLHIFLGYKNDFTGPFPDYFINGNMPEINMFSVSWNDLTGTLPEFGQTNLAMFTVDGNKLTGKIPASITTQTGMINLSLGWNEFEGDFPSDLSDMYRLRYIRANDNNFTGTLPLVDTSNEKLNFLHFQNNQMGQKVPTSLANIDDLPRIDSGDLNISNNNFSQSDIQGLIDALEADGSLDILIY